MTPDRAMAAAFSMDDRAWRRHANPWSVWTRFATLPVLLMAAWSRAWLGWWSLAPVSIVVAWLWLNPRLFPPPQSTDRWASRAVLGERVWLNRRAIPIPDHHRRAAMVLSLVAAAGAIPLAWGLITLEVWPTLLGMTLTYASKMWFLDRMAWLYQDMKDTTEEYRSWLY